jgi:hypothetical protein
VKRTNEQREMENTGIRFLAESLHQCVVKPPNIFVPIIVLWVPQEKVLRRIGSVGSVGLDLYI